MTRVIGVRFRTAGKIYFFDPLNFEIKRGDHVIVETARGIEFGTVMSGVTEVEDEKVVQPLKPVLRIANQRDMEQAAANKGKEKEAFQICLEKIREHGLEMKLIDAEYTFDNNKVLFYFTADGRIDFRELVKDLAGVFKTRIELRQIGVRDETKIVGGIGICGRPLCCHSYLSDFVPVSIKMAKEQNLSLNPTKISGVCGRLMCCLKNEEETYEELNRRLPGIGDQVTTEDGFKGQVQSVNVLRQLVKVVVEEGDEKEIKEYPVSKLQFRRRHGKKEKLDISQEELQELARLEEEDQQELQEGSGKQENSSRREGGRRQEGARQGGRNRQNQESGQRQGGRNRQIQESQEESSGWESGRNRDNGRSRQGGENRDESRNWENKRSHENGEGREENRSRENRRNRDNGRNRQDRGDREGARRRENEQSLTENWSQERSHDSRENWIRENSQNPGEGRNQETGQNSGDSRSQGTGQNPGEGRGRENGHNPGEGRNRQGGRNHQDFKGRQGGRSRQGGRDHQNVQGQEENAKADQQVYNHSTRESRQMEAGAEPGGQASQTESRGDGEQRQKGNRGFRGRNRHFKPRNDRAGQEGTRQDEQS